LIIRIGRIVSRPIHAVAWAPSVLSSSKDNAGSHQSQNVQCSNVLSEPDSDELESVAVYSWNARSIVNNFSSFIYASKYKIYGTTETWLSDHIYNNELQIMLFIIKTVQVMVEELQ